MQLMVAALLMVISHHRGPCLLNIKHEFDPTREPGSQIINSKLVAGGDTCSDQYKMYNEQTHGEINKYSFQFCLSPSPLDASHSACNTSITDLPITFINHYLDLTFTETQTYNVSKPVLKSQRAHTVN